ncbi:MAG: dTDP-4-dehydrorhamnose reductase [Nitrososphaeria archaeon]|nr:dTDP-4-dehydrorhamnose reductase [Nitrososphaeria archaeon]
MNILVTGASGLLGSKLTNILVGKGYNVYSGYLGNRPEYGIPIKLDISNENDVEKVFEVSKPDAVVHAAALTNVDACELKRELAWKTNVIGTKNIVKLSKKYNAFLVYISTDYVFKGDRGMYCEDDVPEPINYYGYTKLKGEEEVKGMLKEYCIARTSVIYGSVPASGKTNFVLWIIEKLRKGEVVNVVVDQYNSPTHNTNLAEMLSEIIEKRMTGTYHLAGATRISRHDFSKLVAETFSLEKNLIMPTTSDKISWTAQRPKDSSLNIVKALRILKSKPLDIQTSLKRLKHEMGFF